MSKLPKLREVEFEKDGDTWEFDSSSPRISRGDGELVIVYFRKKQKSAITQRDIKEIVGPGWSEHSLYSFERFANFIVETTLKRVKEELGE